MKNGNLLIGVICVICGLSAFSLYAATGSVDSGPFNITSGNAVNLRVTGTGTMNAGATNELTVTAYDTNGNVATGYTGSKNLTFTGPGPIGSNTPKVEGSTLSGAFVFTAGICADPLATLTAYKAESVTVHVGDATISSTSTGGVGLSLTVNPLAAANLRVTGTGTMNAGDTNNELTVIAYDTYSNVATSYTGSKNLTFTGPATISTFIPQIETTNIGTALAVAFTAGQSNSGAATLTAYKAEATTVDVSDGTTNSAGSELYDLDLTVSAKAVSIDSIITFSTGPNNTAAGAVINVTTGVVVLVTDQYTNPETGVSVAMTISPDGAQTTTLTVTSPINTIANGTATFNDARITEAKTGYILRATYTY